MEMADILVDVIVPIYNVEAYLPQCLDGFLSQTVRRFRVLLIDDGSSDSSGAIADAYAKERPDLFTVVHQKNKGLGGARNTGLSLVKAPYTWFFDSDDFCGPRTMEAFQRALNQHDGVDVVFFNPVIFDMGAHAYQAWHDEAYIRLIFGQREVISPKDDPRTLELEASVCRCLWRTAFLKEANLSFLEGVCWEDVPPHLSLMHHAESAILLNQEGCYYYRTNAPKKKQITSSSGKSRLDMAPVLDEVGKFVEAEKWGRKDKVFLISFLINYCTWTLHATDDAYRKELVDIFYRFFHRFGFFFALHYLCCSPACFKNKFTFLLFRSPCFHSLAYSRARSSRLKKLFLRVKRMVKK